MPDPWFGGSRYANIREDGSVDSVFYIIGVVVVILAVLSLFGLT